MHSEQSDRLRRMWPGVRGGCYGRRRAFAAEAASQRLRGCRPKKGVPCRPAAPGRIEIARLVADQDAVLRIDGEAAEQIRDHSRSGLAPIVDATISLDGPVRVIGAIFEGIDVGPDGCHFVRHPAVQRLHVAFLVEASGDARLVGDDECETAGIVDRLDGFAGAFDPLQLAGLEGVA